MKLLVASPRYLFLVDAVTGASSIVESHRHEYYGVSWTPDGSRLCLSHSGIDNNSLVTLEDYTDSESGWISLGGTDGLAFLSQPHQILCTETHIIATNTGRNCLTVMRYDDMSYRNVWLESTRWDRKGKDDKCGSHFNSVFLDGDRLYVLAHNWDRPSAVLVLSWPKLDVVERIVTTAGQAHNVWAKPTGEIIICDSLRGSLVEARSNDVLWSSGDSTLITRGLACDGSYVFVGRSIFGDRRSRTESTGGVWILDANSWQLIDSFPIPQSGNIHEVRLIDRPDTCHHGFPLRVPIAANADATAAYRNVSGRRLNGASGFVTVLGHEWRHRRTTCWNEQIGRFFLAGNSFVAEDLSVATIEGLTIGDGIVRAEVEVGMHGFQHAGVVTHYRGPGDSNMVAGLVGSFEGKLSLQLWSHAQGQWRQIDYCPTEASHGTLELCSENGRFTLRFNGEIACCGEAPEHTGPGRVGIRCLGGCIRQVEVRPAAAAELPHAA